MVHIKSIDAIYPKKTKLGQPLFKKTAPKTIETTYVAIKDR